MTLPNRATLLGLSVDGPYQTAVSVLYLQPRTIAARHLKTFEPRTWSAPLAALPPALAFPEPLARKMYHDSEAGELRFKGVMTDADRTALRALSSDAGYRAALDAVFDAPAAYVPAPDEAFISASDLAALFDNPSPPEARFDAVLALLMTHLRSTLSAALVKQTLGEKLKLESSTVDQLVTSWVDSPLRPLRKAIDEFLDPAFVMSSAELAVTGTLFPELTATYRRLLKIATLYAGFGMDVQGLASALEFGPSVGWLDLNALPGVYDGLGAEGQEYMVFEPGSGGEGGFWV